MKTVQQAAKQLGCTVQWVRFLINNNRLEAVKVGRDWAIKSMKIAPPDRPVGWPLGKKRGKRK